MATAKNRALDILRRERTARTYAPELGAPARERVDARAGGRRGVRRVRDPRRPAAHDVLVLPSAAPRDRAGRAHAQHPLRLRRERGRGRVPHRARGHGEAHCAGKEGARELEAPVRSLRRAGSAAAALRRAPRALSPVQRGLSRRAPGARGACGAVRRGHAAGGAAARASDHRDAGDASARRAHVPERGAAAGARGCDREAERPVRTGSAALGQGAHCEGRGAARSFGDRHDDHRVPHRGGDRVAARPGDVARETRTGQ